MVEHVTQISTSITESKSRKALVEKIKATLKSRQYVVCPVLNRRRVYIGNYLDINRGNRSTLQRLQAFHAGLDLVKKADSVITTSKYKNSYELRGITKDRKIVVCHIRDEKTNKGRRLYLISFYWKQLN